MQSRARLTRRVGASCRVDFTDRRSMPMTREHQVALALADALLSGPAGAEEFAARLAHALGRNARWIPGFSRRVFQRFGSQLRHPQRAKLVEFVRADRGYQAAWLAMRKPRIVHYFLDPPPREPRPGPPAARQIRRRILREILDRIPAHRAAHGFRPGHSCITHARPHAAKLVVVRMDLRNFFTSIPARRIHALFATLGYPEATARTLTGLCTSRVPAPVLKAMPNGARLPWLEARQLRE